MVKPESMKEFMLDVQEIFGFLMSQEIAKSPLTPKDTTAMAQSFPGTYTFNRSDQVIRFTTPFYTKYVHEGTKKMEGRPFVIQVFNQKGQETLKKAFRIADKKWRNK